MLPSWLTNEYLQPRLRAYLKDDQVKVVKISAKPATGKGDNFVGVMARIYVDYQLGDGSVQSKTYIVKETCPADAPQAKLFAEYDVYTREMDMYEFILPKMNQLLQEVGLTEKLTADAISVDRKSGTIILEDLAPYKYVNADRVKQLDLAHAQRTLELLAKFHAASIILKERHPELLSKSLYTHWYSREKKGYTEVWLGFFRVFLTFINGQPNLKKLYGDKLKKLHPQIMEYAARSYDVADTELQALIHADVWTTNIMFQYDDAGNPRIPVAIDFQFSNFNSPAVDLHYFFNTSLREEVLDKESELVEYYYNTLKADLDKFSYKGSFPSLKEFKIQFERRRPMCLMVNLLTPLIVYNGSESTDFKGLYDESPQGLRYQKSIYDNEVVVRITTKLLARLDQEGIFDQWA
ncbi:uncharacterized protein LOC108049511 [Drosophila rhopaloa]|uniref:Uncharacterized protein LOC108049511 n=1 Tax=Drosophila rhopaloa TaxID=1041015 RepID=A0A6P4FLR4_DRORH|nr:uncharacterized protein LOC108049511 [Drosophila rhopaloa]